MDNSKLFCNVFFHYSDEDLPDYVKDFTKNEFLRARGEAIELLNPHYEEWNAAYDKEVSGEDDEEYNTYIRNKQNTILDEFNRTWMGPVKLFSNEEAGIAGRFQIYGKEYTMYMTIKLINEKEWMEYHKA